MERRTGLQGSASRMVAPRTGPALTRKGAEPGGPRSFPACHRHGRVTSACSAHGQVPGPPLLPDSTLSAVTLSGLDSLGSLCASPDLGRLGYKRQRRFLEEAHERCLPVSTVQSGPVDRPSTPVSKGRVSDAPHLHRPSEALSGRSARHRCRAPTAPSRALLPRGQTEHGVGAQPLSALSPAGNCLFPNWFQRSGRPLDPFPSWAGTHM